LNKRASGSPVADGGVWPRGKSEPADAVHEVLRENSMRTAELQYVGAVLSSMVRSPPFPRCHRVETLRIDAACALAATAHGDRRDL
jgi:hypothetical protein